MLLSSQVDLFLKKHKGHYLYGTFARLLYLVL